MSTKAPFVLTVCIVFLISYAIMPAVTYYAPTIIRIISLLFVAFWLISELGISGFFKNVRLLIPIYSVIILDMIFVWGKNSQYLMDAIYSDGNMFFISLLFVSLLNRGRTELFKPMIIIVTIACIITIVTTSYGNMVFPYASRSLATGMDGDTAMYNTYRISNIGSFDFIYNLLIPLFLLPYLYHNKIIPRLWTLLLYGMVIFCILQSQFTIALLIALPVVVLFFTKSSIYSSDVIKYILLFGLIALLLYSIIPYMLQWLANVFDDEMISERLNDIATMISGNKTDVGMDANERQDHYQMSINYFMSNPLIGSGGKSGGHSFILDTLGKYGLVGLFCLIIMLRGIYKLYIYPFKEYGIYGYLIFAFFFYIILLFLNPAELFMSITFILPLLSYVIINKNINV